MVLTIYTSDLNGDGEVHLNVPKEFFLDWGQELPANPSSRLGYMPGTLDWTSSTIELSAGDFYTQWQATFTFSGIFLRDYEAGAAIDPVTLHRSGSYHSDADPGSEIPPVPEYYTPAISYEGADIHVIGTDADEIIDRWSGPSWYEYWGSQIIDAGGGDDDLWNLKNGLSIINAGSGNDTVYASAGGKAIIDGGEGDDEITAKIGDEIDGGDGFDFLDISFAGLSSKIEFVASRATHVISDGTNPDTTIAGIEFFDITLSQYDDVFDLRNADLSPGGTGPQSSFDGWNGNDTVYIDHGTVGRARLSSLENLYFDISDSDEAGYITYFDIQVGESLDISWVPHFLRSANVEGGSANDFFYLEGGADWVVFGNEGNDYIGARGEDETGTHTLAGGSGDDTLIGAAGTDTAVFSGSHYDYLIDYDAGTISGPDGTDTFEGIEFFEFDDGTLNLDTGVFEAAPDAALSDAELEERIESLLRANDFGVEHWSSYDGAELTFTYRFETAANADMLFTDISGISAFSEVEKQTFRAALAEFETFLNIRFVEDNSAADADFSFFQVADLYANDPSTIGSGGKGGWRFIGSEWDGMAAFSDFIALNEAQQFDLVLHEIGHTLGLKHPGDYDAGGNNPSGPFLPADEDSDRYTVMSYNLNPVTGVEARHLMLYDIAALQEWWGVNDTHAAGDDTYSGPDDGRVQVVWDTGGTDTFTHIGASGAVIDLRPGYFSSMGATDNFAIAYGTTIENATGGAGADTINGNSFANYLKGLAGNDTFWAGGGIDVIDGGEDTDIASYGFSSAVAEVVSFGGTALVFVSETDRDRLIDIETLRFSDGDVAVTDFPAHDPYSYLAAYADLLGAYGSDTQQAIAHYFDHGHQEGRSLDLFNEYQFLASNTDLIGMDPLQAAQYYVETGVGEGRPTDAFDEYAYLASYDDLLNVLGPNPDAASWHYVTWGYAEGRSTDLFDEYSYLASYSDLLDAFGSNTDAATWHYVNWGYAEGRSTDAFDEWMYLASNEDLIASIGDDGAAATQHYVETGYGAGRDSGSFNAEQYLANYTDLQNAFGDNLSAAAWHFVAWGYEEGRTDDILIA